MLARDIFAVHSFSTKIRQIIIELSKKANVGHIGSALSVADLIAVLYSDILQIRSVQEPDRDRFILSKGHSALALYAALHLKGWLSENSLNSFYSDGSLLGVHPHHGLPGIEFSTGSLGQGLSIGAGAALAAKIQKSFWRVFVLVSDAECNEGSIWEAAMFASQHRLSNLITVVDLNGQQACGYTDEVLSLRSLADRWKSFGWNVYEVDGHCEKALVKTFRGLDANSDRPHAIIANTVFGKGVSFMENKIKWHYWPMSDTEYKQASEEIGAPE
ncbi:MAG: transketolase [Nitrospina sp.]|nr:transketolase [Nitrospina sp.]